jgi:heptosyltransferase II
MILVLVKLVGWLIAHTPEFLLNAFSKALGYLLYYGYGSRRKMMLHSIACSFPEKPEAWRTWIARTSCVRLMETSLLSVAAPFLSEKRILKMSGVAEGTRAVMRKVQNPARPLVLGTMHLAYWEGLTWLPFLLRPEGAPPLLTIFRPLNDPVLDDWLKRTRERFGVQLMSRKSGLHAALHTLQKNGSVTILFDQSAGSHGLLTKFLGRECSTTPLPGMLAEKSSAVVGLVYARRTAFWRFTIVLDEVACESNEKDVTLALNRDFEALMRADEEICASWLWLHKRWRILDRPEERKKLMAKRGGLIG